MERAAGTARATAQPGSSAPLVRPVAAALPAAVIAGVMVWWAWERGAYFPVAFFPGAIVIFATLALLFAFVPWPRRLGGSALLSLCALIALGGWTLLSALWSPAADVALEDGLRVLTYAAAFALGAWICLVLGQRRALLSLAPVAAAGAAIAVATLVALAIGDDPSEMLDEDATLKYPLGYRSAVAAFFVMSVLSLVPLSASRELDWRVRAAAAAAATLCIELAVLAQSRGAVFATAAGVACFIVLHPARWRASVWLGLSVLGALAALPLVLAVYNGSGGVVSEAQSELRAACAGMAISTAVVLVVAAALCRVEFEPRFSERAQRAGRIAAIAVAAVALLGLAVVAFRAEGGPLDALNRQVDEFSAGTPDLREESSRYGFDLRSDRGDFWRVALDDLEAEPLSGRGAGGFRYSYLLSRDADQQPEDPHSVVMLMASELGLPGLVLFGLFVGAGALALWRSRRVGSAAAALAASAAGIGAYWLVHAGVEWFWAYPSITLPMAYALGAAAAPAHSEPRGGPRAPSRGAVAGGVAAGLVALALVPLWLSERYMDAALDSGSAGRERAYADLDRAADLNPLSDRPLAAEAIIAEGAGDYERALAALARAQERKPDEWTLFYLEARIRARLDRDAALRALARARDLNPGGGEIDLLEEKLEQASP
ncbi:MAG: O-antigen ligase family protein [Solirubrobacterales bacterium]